MEISIEIMVFYILEIISLLKYQGNKYFKYLPYIIIFIFMSIRFNYGDESIYREEFYNIHYFQAGYGMVAFEPLYVFLNQLLPSFYSIIILNAALYVFAFYFLISKILNYKQRLIAVIVWILHPYILMVDMSAIRQSFAIALFMLGVKLGHDKGRKYFFICCALGVLFHKSAILLLPISYIIDKKIKQKCMIILWIIAVFLILNQDELLSLVMNTLQFFGLNTPNYIAYAKNSFQNSIQATALSFFMMLFLILFKENIEIDKQIYIDLSILALLCESLQGGIQQFGRISMYFLPFLCLSLPLLLCKNSLEIELYMIKKKIVFNEIYCIVFKIMFLSIFSWKLLGFLTEHFAYHTIFTL